MSSRIYAITGPTGVGKTALSLDVAEVLNADIVSCDSRQVFRHLDIGTAKPSLEDLRRVPHHFIDERELTAPWSAGLFAEEAGTRIREIQAQGRQVLLVGGSTLYLHALTHGLAALPEANLELRAELNAIAETETGRLALFEELQQVDPQAAATLDPTKSQRLVRFVEIARSSGRPASAYWQEAPSPPFDVRVAVLDRPRDDLYARIESRVDAMLVAGLLMEVSALRADGFSRANTPALRTIGYQEPLAYLDGELGYDEMIERMKRNTRRYAKRQLTWFRRAPEYHWLPASGGLRDVLDTFEMP